MKCISDGLKDIAYKDDSQIGHAEAFDHDMTSSFTYEKPISPEIDSRLHEDQEFVAVYIGPRHILRIESSVSSYP